MAKKSNQRPASKTSSAAAFAVADSTNTGNKSSILRAAFAPSDFQLALFASVIQGLEGQNLRIHDTNTGRLQCEHVLGPKELVTSLDWGHYYGRRDQSKKKRKRPSDVNGTAELDQGDVVVAFGTNTSDIRMYSPAEDKIVGTLAGGHTGGVKDFKFTADRPQEGWSIGGDNKLVQWDLVTGQRTRVISLSTTSAFTTLSRPLASNPPVICASQTPHIVNLEDESPIKFPAMRNSIQTIITSSTSSISDGLFLASDNDRYINVFDPKSGQLAMNLVAEKEVTSLSLYSTQGAEVKLALEKQVLAAVTQDGTIELFARPFVRPQGLEGSKGSSLKARSMQMTRRAEASLRITKTSESDDIVPVVAASFQGPDLLVAWAQGGIIPLFERVRWLNEETDELAFTGVKNIAKTKSSSILQSATTNGTKNANESHVNEKKIVVEQGDLADDDVNMEEPKQDAVTEDDSEVDSEDDDGFKQQKEPAAQDKEKAESDVEMQNAAESGAENEDEDDEEETGAEPSFGELMRAHAAEEIDVEAELEDDVHTRSLIPGKPITTVQQIPSGVSLSTVLSQSLKTNDNDMLEACFHTGDSSTIRTTIQRLDSPLAATLLQRLAERLSARPGRYGHLLVWVQWTCIAHGGALAGNKDLLKQMSTLFKVMDQRSSTLSSLLLLKGKLDMLDAQLGLRQSLRENADHMDSEDEENVIYVEGYDDDEVEDSDAEATKNIDTPRTKAIRDQTDISMIDEDEDSGSEDDEEDEEEEDEEGPSAIFDVEAEESAGSSDAEESPNDDEDDDEDDDADSAGSIADFIADTEDDDSEVENLSRPPPSKKARLSQGGGKGKKQSGSGRK
ncbi:Dip2/Utp12 family-domain-containing protein [Aspergillus spinulosporus]